ncbi:MAG TPA: bifunctional [glutamate--ammonia ligase]-adenylyl-L-tyrosine phosphorylase/[glutamate--ammonia-ligase] adenylyltransferase [Steroidobacteraceae bacterium]|nr:bifunctional [glutamate--ammonia ligase]-adenylyl-L-tyrosine phosphorylase/[glutamate--ammonia-ligase] adenylyltransferase [Steroidobacteraceae bacterium]
MTPELAAYCEQQLTRVRDSGALAVFEAAAPELRDALPRVLAASDFVCASLGRDSADEKWPLSRWLIDQAALTRPLARGEMAQRLKAAAGAEPDLAGFMAALRRQREREMVRIAWRDLAGWANLNETLADTSAFADVAIEAAVEFAGHDLARMYGEPRSVAGIAQPFIVLGMGKLGGEELNFSSDIDLIFVFPDKGTTSGARCIDNEDFFTRLGRLVIRLLGERTAEGSAFRVDMRLRPFGDSGPLTVSALFLDNYLQTHGRDWERYAWIKARAITGVEAYKHIHAESVRPFVYRRYLDFGVFEALREMKALIQKEVARRDLAEHVKLGPGGIREIEFVVQAFQLIRGGQDRRMQTQSLLAVLPQLAGGKLLPARVAQELEAAYVFLRRLENRLQMLGDNQVHTVPGDPLTRERVAMAMGFDDWEACAAALDQHRARVTYAFQDVMFARNEAASVDMPGVNGIAEAWMRGIEGPQLAAALETRGFAEAARAAALLTEFRGNATLRRLDAPGRARLDTLMPRLLAAVADVGLAESPQVDVLRRVLRILEAIGSRSAYFALLNENAQVRRKLVELAARGEFLAAQIASHPLLLDELLDETTEGLPASRADLEAEADARLAHLAEDEPERQVEVLRQFQRAAIFRVAMADLSGKIPLMRVSDYLTEIAEIIVERAMRLGWAQMTAQFGVPQTNDSGGRRAVKVCAVGYGKLGGNELGYASDLDLVFLHDSGAGQAETDAAKPVDNQVFFIRFAQRVLHLLTMHSSAGRLYEVDVRLRPSGKGGMLITRVGAFAEYQEKEAWTWEHQALLHARAVAGDPGLRAEFERVRVDILVRCVRRETLQSEVRDMRLRMRKELSRGRPGSGKFDIKQDAGGTADIEFLAQYWALLYAATHPPVVMFADTIRQLESVASANLVPQATVDVLTHAYRRYRERAHHLSLDQGEAVVQAEEFAEERAAVSAIWDATMAASNETAPAAPL